MRIRAPGRRLPVDEPLKLRSASSPNIECGFEDLNYSIIPAEIDGARQTRIVLSYRIVHEPVIALDSVPRERTSV